MVECNPDAFLNELRRLFEKTKQKGSVRVTTKRSNLKSLHTRKPDPTLEFKCLIRATDGKKKISTTVGAKEYVRFQGSYGTILRAYMDNLKKRERSKGKTAKK